MSSNNYISKTAKYILINIAICSVAVVGFMGMINNAVKPRWSKGDCVQSQDFEEFEDPLPVYKIKIVGKRKYLVDKFDPKATEAARALLALNEVQDFTLLDASDFRKVVCPKFAEKYK